MARKPQLYLDEKYHQLKKTLSKEGRDKIRKIEKLCLDTRLNYFDVEREVETMIWGPFPRHFTLEDIHQLKTPLAELADYLLRRAGHIRGIQFSDEVEPAKKEAKQKEKETVSYFYATLQGEKLNLKKLNKEQKQLLRRFYRLYQENHDYPDFCNKAESDCYHHCWVDQKMSKAIIYQLLNDLADRLALKQGFLKLGENSNADFTENEKALKEFLS